MVEVNSTFSAAPCWSVDPGPQTLCAAARCGGRKILNENRIDYLKRKSLPAFADAGSLFNLIPAGAHNPPQYQLSGGNSISPLRHQFSPFPGSPSIIIF